MKARMQWHLGPRTVGGVREGVAVRLRSGSRPQLASPCIGLAMSIAVGAHLAFASPVGAALTSGAYQTLPGATVREWGDRVPNGSRMVPLSGTLLFDLSTGQAALTAILTNAVLEGGDPFALTVRSSSSSQLADGTFRFLGDYLRDIYPSGTQYLFDWRFSSSTKGDVVWNGMTGWAGGHAWYVTISNLTLLPVSWLSVSRVSPASFQISWSTNFADYMLEYATNLPALAWSSVTNVATDSGDRLSVTLDAAASRQFYRLRRP